MIPFVPRTDTVTCLALARLLVALGGGKFSTDKELRAAANAHGKDLGKSCKKYYFCPVSKHEQPWASFVSILIAGPESLGMSSRGSKIPVTGWAGSAKKSSGPFPEPNSSHLWTGKRRALQTWA